MHVMAIIVFYTIRSYSPDGNYSSSKRQKRGRKENIELYDSFSEEDVEGDGGNENKKEKVANNEVDLDLLFLEEDTECLKNTVNGALERYKPANVFLTTGVSTGLCGSELYGVVSDVVLTHLESQDSSCQKGKEKLLEMFQKNSTGLQVSNEFQKYRNTNKLIKDVGPRNKAVTAQADLSIRNKLRKSASNQRVKKYNYLLFLSLFFCCSSVFQYQVLNYHQTGTRNSMLLE